jgi:SAM-dependent methyltransferase
MLPRIVEAETLDHLAPDDPAAERSRRDLFRVNRVMGARGILVDAIREALPRGVAADRPLRVLEIGCGDGRLLLGVASALRSIWPQAELTLLDRQAIVSAETIAAYDSIGWWPRPLVADVLEWAADGRAPAATFDLVVTNLFLHHFESEALRELFAAIAARSHALVASEPRRGRLALAASHLVGAIGANAVTREDAVLSVRAGFQGQELSALWPRAGEWRCREYRAGLFSHVFIAARAGSAGQVA